MEALLQLDGNILLWIQQYIRHDFMDWFWTSITTLGNFGWFWITLSIILLFFKPTRKAGFVSLLSLGFCFLIANGILKPLVARPRPYTQIAALEILIPPEKDLSFPSGHTTASFASACILFRMLPKKYGVCAVVLAVLIALSRLYVGIHYPTDVIGGVVIGVFGSMLVYHVYLWAEKKWQAKAAR